MANNKVLIVDDDEHIVELIKLYMDKEGFDTVTANNGKKAVELFKSEAPAIVILDVMMPEMDGWQVCREIRRVSNIPIIMLTAKGETFDKVLGLELGADDYMVKPFEPKELLARVKAVLRRSDTKESNAEKEIVFPNLTINLSNYELKINGNIVEVPPKELELLYFLASNPNRVFTRSLRPPSPVPENELAPDISNRSRLPYTSPVQIHTFTPRIPTLVMASASS